MAIFFVDASWSGARAATSLYSGMMISGPAIHQCFQVGSSDLATLTPAPGPRIVWALQQSCDEFFSMSPSQDFMIQPDSRGGIL
jgi:hypothetical protein